MANVTNLKTITNNTPYAITVRNGENTQQLFTVNGNAGHNQDLWVPWVGNDSENWKVIQIKAGTRGETDIWVFQDYWNPPHENAIKCYYGSDSSRIYTNAWEIDGNNRGGGEKGLILELHGRDIYLKII